MAAGGDYKFNIDKLEETEDWITWKWHISIILRSHGLEGIVDGTRTRVELPVEPKTATKQQILNGSRMKRRQQV